MVKPLYFRNTASRIHLFSEKFITQPNEDFRQKYMKNFKKGHPYLRNNAGT
jgi:hypothetical protein